MQEILKTFDLEPLDVAMIAVGAFLFIVFWRVISKTLFDPYIKLLETREAATEGASHEAMSIREKASNLMNSYNEKVTAVRVTLMEERLKKTSEAKKKAQEIIDKAEGEAQEAVRKVRWEIQENISKLREDVFKNTDTLASLLVEKIEKGGAAG